MKKESQIRMIDRLLSIHIADHSKEYAPKGLEAQLRGAAIDEHFRMLEEEGTIFLERMANARFHG